MANGAFVSDLDSSDFRSFIFPETVFTAVTAYQNQLVSKPRVPFKMPVCPHPDSEDPLPFRHFLKEISLSPLCGFPSNVSHMLPIAKLVHKRPKNLAGKWKRRKALWEKNKLFLLPP